MTNAFDEYMYWVLWDLYNGTDYIARHLSTIVWC